MKMLIDNGTADQQRSMYQIIKEIKMKNNKNIKIRQIVNRNREEKRISHTKF